MPPIDANSAARWQVGGCLVQPADLLIQRGGAIVALRPMAWTLLLALLRRPNGISRARELMAHCWPRQVTNAKKLGNLVSELRLVLGQDDAGRSPIVTVPRRGYILMATPMAQPDAPRSAMGAPSFEPKWPAVPVRAAALAGRQQDLAALLQTLEAPELARRRLTLVTGEAGMGKTALLEAGLQSWPARHGWRVLRGSAARALDVPEPYRVWRDTLNRYLRQRQLQAHDERQAELVNRWLAALSDSSQGLSQKGVHPSGPGGPASILREAWIALLCGLCEDFPLLIVIDDMQWCDAASLSLLMVLLDDLPAGRVEVWLGCRVTPADDADARPAKALDVAGLLLDLCPRLITLKPLDEHEVAQVMVQRLGGSREVLGAAARVHASTGGLPRLVDMVCTGLESAPQLEASLESVIRTADGGIGELLMQQLSRLPDDGIATAETLAAMAGVAPARLVLQALGLSAARARKAFAQLSVAGLVRQQATWQPDEDDEPDGNRILSLHPRLLAEVLWHRLTPDRRLQRSTQLMAAMDRLQYLQRHPNWAPQVAFVLTHTGRHAEAVAALRGLLSADQSGFSAEESKVALLRIVDELAHAGSRREVLELRLEALNALVELSALHSGNAGAAVLRHLKDIQELTTVLPSPRSSYIAQYVACLAAWRSGRADIGYRSLQGLMEAAGQLGPVELAQARILQGGLLRSMGRIREASSVLLALIRAPVPDASRHSHLRLKTLRAHASIVEHWNLCILGDPVRGLEGLASATDTGASMCRPYLELAAKFWTGSALRQLACPKAATLMFDEVLRLTSSLRTRYMLAECHAALQACLPAASRDQALLSRLSNPNVSTIPTWGNRVASRLLAESLIAHGDLEGAAAIALATRADLEYFPLYEPDVHRLDAELAWARGEAEAAIECWVRSLRAAHRQSNTAAALQAAVQCMARGVAASDLGSRLVMDALCALTQVRPTQPQIVELCAIMDTVKVWLREG